MKRSFPNLFIVHMRIFSLHNYSTRCDSLDLHVVNVPKLITTTYQLKEQMSTINEQREQRQISLLPLNGDIRNKRDSSIEKRFIQKRINELEYELKRLKSQLRTKST